MQDPAGVSTSATERAATQATQPPLVLIVDDDADMRTYLRRCLKAIPTRVVEAAGGMEALEIARAALPEGLALVITDVVMPGMDGLTLKAALGEDPDLRHVPVLLITGEALRVRDGPLLRKPFNARGLHNQVQSLLAAR